MGGYTWFPSSINHWPVFFIWRVSRSLITGLVVIGVVLGMRYVVMKSILLVWSGLHGASSLLAEVSLSRETVQRGGLVTASEP